jgi:hypothetical protein
MLFTNFLVILYNVTGAANIERLLTEWDIRAEFRDLHSSECI